MNEPVAGWRRYERSLLIALALVVALVRLWQCAKVPANTGDLPRHILYGLVVLEHGVAGASQTLHEVSRSFGSIAWSRLPYNYPPVALGFFTLTSAVAPTLFFAKFALTVVEAVNALLVFRLTRQRWAALVYWALPGSIWWVSREGQFEPVQTLFVFLGLWALDRSRPVWGMVALALAIQAKVTALFLVPLFLWRLWKQSPRALVVGGLGFVAGFLPMVLVSLQYPVFDQVTKHSTAIRFSAYYWNPFVERLTQWVPGWVVGMNAVTTYAALAVLGILLLKRRDPAMLAPAAFLFITKIHLTVQFWYFNTLPAFLMPIRTRHMALVLMLLPLLDVYSVAQLVAGPFGYLGWRGFTSAFQAYALP